MAKITYISEEEVSKLLNWKDTYDAVEAAMAGQVTGRAIQSERTFTKVPENETQLLTMPGFLSDQKYGALGCKLVVICPSNAKLDPPQATIGANITLFDESNGLLKAVIAGTGITTWRTAAASAVATKYLTSGKKLETLAILGAGTQGRIHAMAFCHYFKFKEVRVWNHNFVKAQRLSAELNQTVAKSTFRAVDSNETCVRGADVIITATFSSKPIVEQQWLKDGCHINAVGAGNAEIQELSDSIYLSSDVFVDHFEGAAKELPRLKALGIQFKGEIGGLITNKLSIPTSNRITVFQSLGMAVEDCAMARMIYDLYEKQNSS